MTDQTLRYPTANREADGREARRTATRYYRAEASLRPALRQPWWSGRIEPRPQALRRSSSRMSAPFTSLLAPVAPPSGRYPPVAGLSGRPPDRGAGRTRLTAQVPARPPYSPAEAAKPQRARQYASHLPTPGFRPSRQLQPVAAMPPSVRARYRAALDSAARPDAGQGEAGPLQVAQPASPERAGATSVPTVAQRPPGQLAELPDDVELDYSIELAR